MPVEKKKELTIKVSNQELFAFLKAQFPSLFGTKVFADVAYMGQDVDATFFAIKFAQENEP